MRIKRFVLLFSCIAIVFGLVANASADSSVLRFASIEITGKSETATVEEPSINGGQIRGGITFDAQGDFVDYRLVIENSDEYSYRIDSVEDSNSLENLTITYIHDDTVEANATTDLLMHMEYSDMLVNTEAVDINDLRLTVRFTRLGKPDEKHQEISPDTSDGIMSYAFGSGVVLLIAVVALRGLMPRRIRIVGTGTALVLTGAALSLYAVRAANIEESTIGFSNIHLASYYEDYTVTIDTGNGPVSQKVTYGTPLSEILVRPTKAGYYFDKWTDASGNTVDESGIVTGPIAITAKMLPNQYRVVFNKNDGTDESSNQEMTYDVAVNLAQNSFERPGYAFVGWATSADGEVVYEDKANVENLTTTTDDVNLYAKWTKRTDIHYIVRHKYENLTNDDYTNDDEEFNNGSVDEDITPDIKHVDGFVDPTRKTVQISADGSSIIEYEYKRIRVQLSLNNKDDIESGSSVDGEYKYGTQISLTARNINGCNFMGWSDGSAIVSEDRVYKFAIKSSVELTPTYQIQKFTVTIDRGDGPIEHTNIEYGTLLSTLLGDEPSKTGYAFDGWFDGSEAVTGLTPVTGAMNIVAAFTANTYNIVFHSNDGTDDTATQEMTYDIAANLLGNGFDRPGYEFLGWATSVDGEVIYADRENVNNLTTTTDDVDLYAKWTLRTNITYAVIHRYQKAVNASEYDEVIEDLQGSVDTEYNTDDILQSRTGFNDPANRTYVIEASGNTQVVLEYSRKTFQLTLGNTEYIDSGSTAAGEYRYEYPISVTAKTRTGYDFDGWYSGETRKTTNSTYEFEITEATTLEPRYQIQSYSVIVDKADGSASAEYSIEYGTALAEYLVEPQVTGYHFVEWRDGDDQVVTGETIVEGPMAITAIIAPNVYHIVFNANGGTGTMSNLEMTYDESENLPANVFTRAGYTFDGWATSADGEKLYEDGDEVNNLTTGTDDVTLYAKWKLRTDIPYTVYHRYERVGTGFDQEEASAFGSVDIDITPETVPREGFQDPVADGSTPIPGQIDASGESYFIYNYYRVQKQLTLNSAEYIGTDTPTGSYKYGTTITVTAFDRLKYEFKGWSTDNGATITDTNVTYSFEITEDTTLTPVYEEIPFYYVFNHPGACQINSGAAVVGDDCGLHPELGYIDTGVKLYDDVNYNLDYEIGFTIDSLATEQVDQATFLNAKYENSSSSAIGTGLVLRKGGQKPLEISHAVNGYKKAEQYNVTAGSTVRIIRFNGAIYYSINGGTLTLLQSVRDTSDYKDTVTWFGASYDTYTESPWRYLNGTLSNMYIKLGVYDGPTATVTFDANGGTVSPESITLLAGRNLTNSGYGELPTPTDNGSLYFIDWYLDKDVWDQRVTESTVFDSDATIYARWEASSHACVVFYGEDAIYKDSLSECISSVPDNTEQPVEVALLRSTEAVSVDIPSTKKIYLNGRGLELKGNGSAPIIRNWGTLYLVDVTLTGNSGQGTVNNGTDESRCSVSSCLLYVDGGKIEGGTKQAIYNRGGYVEIYGGAEIIGKSNSIRATVHNLDSGEIRIIDASVISQTHNAVLNAGASGKIYIGTSGDEVKVNTPIITSTSSNAVETAGEVYFYDGTITAKKHAINKTSTPTAINAAAIVNSPEPGYNIMVTNDGSTTQTTTLYYEAPNGS